MKERLQREIQAKETEKKIDKKLDPIQENKKLPEVWIRDVASSYRIKIVGIVVLWPVVTGGTAVTVKKMVVDINSAINTGVLTAPIVAFWLWLLLSLLSQNKRIRSFQNQTFIGLGYRLKIVGLIFLSLVVIGSISDTAEEMAVDMGGAIGSAAFAGITVAFWLWLLLNTLSQNKRMSSFQNQTNVGSGYRLKIVSLVFISVIAALSISITVEEMAVDMVAAMGSGVYSIMLVAFWLWLLLNVLNQNKKMRSSQNQTIQK